MPTAIRYISRVQDCDDYGDALSWAGLQTFNRLEAPLVTGSYSAQSFIPVVTADNYETPFYWERASAPLTTPTSDATGDCLHPDVVYIPGGWNGYTYWMVMTPFAGSATSLENPEILASNDGETWADPGSNPIDGPPGEGFYSDPCLMFYQNTLYCYWRWSVGGDGDRILYMTSTDGVAWTGPTTVLDAGGSTPGTLGSPIVRNVYGTFYMWTVDGVASPNELHLRTSSIPTGSWSSPTTCTLTFGGAEEIFHFNCMWDGDAFYSVWTSGTALLFGRSYDGENWDMNGVPLAKETTGGEWDERKYQSAMIRRPDRHYFDVFYSAYENASPNLHRIGRGKLHWTDGDDAGNLHGYVDAGSASRYLNIEDTFLRVRSGDGAAATVITSDTVQFGAPPAYTIQWDGDDAVHTITAGAFLFAGGILQVTQGADGPSFGTGVPAVGFRVSGYDDKSTSYASLTVEEHGHAVLSSTGNLYLSPADTGIVECSGSGFGLFTNKYFRFGSTSTNYAQFEWDTTQTTDTLLLGLSDQGGGAVARTLLVCDVADMGFDFAHAAQSNPTIFIHSANQATDEWVSLTHNQTDAVIGMGTGDLNILGAISLLEKSADPVEPAEGECVIWMSDGTGKGDDGDVLVASKAGGATKWTTLFDHSAGAGW